MKNGKITRESLLELFLLAIFAFGLFISKQIVDQKNRILPGPGISLAGTGVTASLPEQYGWRVVKQWQYENDNTFALPACLMGRSGPLMEVSWRYILTSPAKSSREVLEQFVSESGAELPTVYKTAGRCPLEYIYFSSPHDGQQEYFGAAVLDFGRVLTLQVVAPSDPDLTERIFLALAENLDYQKPEELFRGVELLQKARAQGLGLFTSEPARPYIIRDSSGNRRGYEITRAEMDSKQQLQIQRITALPAGVVTQREHRFTGVNVFETFDWQCQNIDRVKLLGTFTLTYNENGELQTENISGKTQTIRPGPAILPEILLDRLVGYFLEDSSQPCVADILYFDGVIVPSRIFSIPPAQALGKTDIMAFAIRMEMANGWLAEFYFDKDKKPLGKVTVETSRRILLWELAREQDIEKDIQTPPVRKGPMAGSGTEQEYARLRGKRKTI